MSATLIINGQLTSNVESISPLGKLAVGTKILIQLSVNNGVLCFTQEPNTNGVQPKAIKDGVWTKKLTVIKLADGTVAVQGWPGNGMYTAKYLGNGNVDLTFHAVVRFHAEFFYVEDRQIVAFHDFMGSPLTTQLKGLPAVVGHIKAMVVSDTLPKATPLTDPEVGTVLWYSASRSIGAVVMGTNNLGELRCARVHVSQILGQSGLPILHAGDRVTAQSAKDVSGEDTTFITEYLGVSLA